MNRDNFPLITLGLSVPLLSLLIFGSQLMADDSTRLPLLTLLAISEFGAFANAIAAWFGVARLWQGPFRAGRTIVTVATFLLAGVFTWALIHFWPL